LRGKRHLSEEKAAEFTVYMRKEGRITVPREVRTALNIEEGNLVRCKIEKLETG
jgi:bifunctional DNA-binding transcriptional regulator/antitoxin component of YhaV-PrlF toxin-antitoxin module